MKKILTTAMVLGSLVSTAQAMDTTTSPLYFPKDGEVVSRTKLGFFNQNNKVDRVSASTGSEEETDLNIIREEMSFGVLDNLSIDAGFNYKFNQEIKTTGTINNTAETNSSLDDYYVGATIRLADQKEFKLDLGGTLEEDDAFDLFVKGGFAFDRIDTALTFGIQYTWEQETKITGSTTATDKTDAETDFYLAWENEFELAKDYIFAGIDLSYAIMDEYVNERTAGGTATKTEIGEYDIWSVAADINYKINDNITVGLYAEYSELDNTKNKEDNVLVETLKDREIKEFGFKLDTRF